MGHNGNLNVMIRMGFGLSVAPKVTVALLDKVLSLYPCICSGINSYVDDIAVNESVLLVSYVRGHLVL